MGHYLLDVPGLGEVAVRRDVVALLLVEAGAGLDHGQLAAAHAAEGGHHVGQRSQLGGYTVTHSTGATALVNASFLISFDNILDVRVTSCAFNQSNIHICRLE